MSKLGTWGPWERVEEGSGEAGSEASKIVELSKFQLKKKDRSYLQRIVA